MTCGVPCRSSEVNHSLYMYYQKTMSDTALLFTKQSIWAFFILAIEVHNVAHPWRISGEVVLGFPVVKSFGDDVHIQYNS